jgi:hypothetical protein
VCDDVLALEGNDKKPERSGEMKLAMGGFFFFLVAGFKMIFGCFTIRPYRLHSRMKFWGNGGL